MFDVGADPATIAEQLRRSDVLAPLVDAAPGLRVPGAWCGFELAVRAILGQQVTVKGAATLAARLVKEFGEPMETGREGLTSLFPRPGTLAATEVIRLRYGLDGEPVTLREVGKRLGVSHERVRQLESSALEHLARVAEIEALRVA